MLNLNSILIGTMQPKVMGEFYEKVFGRPADMIENNSYGWKVEDTFLTIMEHSEVKGATKDPARIILNFETKQVQEEFERIKNFGTTIIKEPYEIQGMWIATLADPDGNYFQLMSPWEG